MHPVTQMLRCYLEPIKKPKSDKPHKESDGDLQQLELQEVERKVGPNWKPWGGPTLVLDVETTTDLRQAVRFGVYRLYGHDYFNLMELAKRYRIMPKIDENDPMATFERAKAINRMNWDKKKPYGNVPRDVLDELQIEGVFYNPEICSDVEITVLQMYSQEHNLPLLTMEDFITKIFFKVYSLKSQKWVAKGKSYIPNDLMPCMVVGHNLPFDLGGMAYDAAPSTSLYGGLSLKLRESFPNVIIKKIGFAKHMYGTNKRFGRLNHIFVNTQQLGRALFGASVKSSLAGMAEALGIKDEKGQVDYYGPITAEYISYCRMDVNLTWQVYQGLRTLYLKHGFTALNKKGQLARPIDKIYSEASIGKGYLEQLGIKSFLEKNPDFDHANHTAPFMAGMYGGRSEVRWRLELRQGMQADFKSQYPTMNALMKLQELDISRSIKVIEDKTGLGEAANFLRAITLNDLNKKETWPKMRGAALIDPSGCILPVRTVYHVKLDQDKDAKAQQIGVNEIITAPPSWYAFPDIIASKMLTGRCPKILQTITLEPEGVQDGLQKHAFFGDEEYTIDLTKDDLFQRLIDMRSVVKKEKKDGWKPKEQGIKLTSNGTSYGVKIEFVVDERDVPTDMKIYAPGRTLYKKARNRTRKTADGDETISGFKVERPGKWFTPWGPLIPACGRLLLAIAERLAADREIKQGFCDTDSMFFIKPDGMGEADLISRVKEITGWLQALNPYSGNDPIFNLEDVNYALVRNEQGEIVRNDKGEAELHKGEKDKEGNIKYPLRYELPWLLAVSAKRYGIANLRTDKQGKRQWIIREASGHGLGHITAPKYKDDTLPIHETAPHRKRKKNGVEERYYSYGEICKGSNSKLFLDMWRAVFGIVTAHKEKRLKQDLEEYIDLEIDRVMRKLPGLEAYQMVQQSISSRDEWLAQKAMPWKRPYGFYNSIPQPVGLDIDIGDDMNSMELAKCRELKNTSFFTQGGRDITLSTLAEYQAKGKGNEGLYRRDNGEFPVEMFDKRYGLHFQTVAEALQGYFTHCEYKSNGKYGLLERRKLAILTQELIGKESHDIAHNDDDPALDDEDLLNRRIVITRMNTDMLQQIGFKSISKTLGLSQETIKKNLLHGFPLSDKAMSLLRKSIEVDEIGNYKIVPIKQSSAEAIRCATMRRQLEAIRNRLSEHGRMASIEAIIKAVDCHIDGENDEAEKIKGYLFYIIPDLLSGVELGKPLFKSIMPVIEKAIAQSSGADKFSENMLRLNETRKSKQMERREEKERLSGEPVWELHPITCDLIQVSPAEAKRLRRLEQKRLGMEKVRAIGTRNITLDQPNNPLDNTI